MREILAAVLLLTTVDAYFWGQQNSGFGHGWGRGPPFQPPGHRFGKHNPFLNWTPQQQQQQQQHQNGWNDAGDSEVEWICRSPKTNNMMIILSQDSKDIPTTWTQWPQQPQPDHQQNEPNYPTGNGQVSPKPIPEEPPEPNNNQPENHIPTSIPESTERTPPNRPHQGEGLIDVRIGG